MRAHVCVQLRPRGREPLCLCLRLRLLRLSQRLDLGFCLRGCVLTDRSDAPLRQPPLKRLARRS